MPKIPTFEARGRITAESAGVQTGIQVSPTASPAAALADVARVAENYYIKQRDTAEKVESAKKVFEIKGELDKYIESEKENINEENAINNFKSKYNNYVKQQLSTITNSRVKKRIQQNLDLELSEYIYNIKSNSYKALEKDSLLNINNELNSLSGKYATTDNSILKVKYKTQAKDKIREFAQDFGLPENVLNKKLEAVDRDFLLADMNQLAGLANGAEQIKGLDDRLNGTKFLSDNDFGQGVYNSYLTKISEITIKGDVNSDYDRALDLVDELKEFKRSNGYEVKTGDISLKIDELEQKIINEQIQHNSLLEQQGNNKAFSDYANDLQKALTTSITDKGSGIPRELKDELAAAEIEAEYKQNIKDYLSVNPDADLEEKKQFARSLVFTLKSIYEDRNIAKLNSYNLENNLFDIQTEYQRVLNDVKLLSENKLDPEILKQYQTMADNNGISDVLEFINIYLPTLETQVKATIIRGE